MARIRPKRVAALLKEEMAGILTYDLKDPGLGGLITVTDAEVTPDLKRAKVYVSILGQEEAKKKMMNALGHAKGFIRKLLGERLKLRYTPELIFELDRTIEKQQRISEILEKIEEKETESGDKENS